MSTSINFDQLTEMQLLKEENTRLKNIITVYQQSHNNAKSAKYNIYTNFAYCDESPDAFYISFSTASKPRTVKNEYSTLSTSSSTKY